MTVKRVLTSEIAKKLDVSERTIREVCQSNGIGKRVHPKLRILTAQDIPRIKAILAKRVVGHPTAEYAKKLRERVRKQKYNKRKRAPKKAAAA